MTSLQTGRVVRTDAKVCHVLVDGRVIQAAPRGALYGVDSERRQEKNPVAVGDDVEVDLASSPASLDRVLKRRNQLSRIASSHDPREQVLAANVDQMVIVGSLAKPGFSSNRTDRILSACWWQHIPVVLVLNKIDLVSAEELDTIRDTYERIPIQVLPTCATKSEGLETLRELLKGKTSVVYGASGAGKSSLLNALQPGLNLKIGKISKFWDQGKHTTTFSLMHFLDFGCAVIDTPGIRVFRPYGIPPASLRDCFPEFRRYQLRCQFPDCGHDHEPGCAVFDAVEAGHIAASRYASYVEMLDELRKAPEAVEDVEPDSDP
ncbi:MAG: ribosome small subunit-dependent GTPase A [Planctomycetota bacterium]|nr:ribosome small subunit-dependent GTPase A [Planctomycetota bacterium]